MSAPPEHADLLAAVADELMLVREGIDGIEALVSDLVRRAPPEERPNALTQAQALDALTQRLEALSGVLRMLGGGASPSEAVSRLSLADMAGRLRPAAGEHRHEAAEVIGAAGEPTGRDEQCTEVGRNHPQPIVHQRVGAADIGQHAGLVGPRLLDRRDGAPGALPAGLVRLWRGPLHHPGRQQL
jgi:hypothetical protein